MKSKSKKEVNGIVIPLRSTPRMERYVEESGCGAMHVKSINKTEQRAMAQIEAMGWTALVQPTNLLPLPGGGTYTPDFVAWDERPGAEKVLYIIEVKGGYRGAGWEQGYERYRRAAQFYNGRAGIFKFLLMEWGTKDKAWTYQWW